SVTSDLSGVMASSASVDVVVKSTPPTPMITATDTLLCQGLATKLTSSVAAGDQWYKDGIAIPGVTGQGYLTDSAGAYTVTAQDNGCSSGPSASRIVALVASPAASVTSGGPRQFCTGDSVKLQANTDNTLVYQWLVDGNPIPGATTPNYAVTRSGTYTVL